MDEDQAAQLDAILEETEAVLGPCEERLLTQTEASAKHGELWGRALAALPEGSDPWRVLDRERRSYGAWWHQGISPYVDPRDCEHFAHLRAALKKVLDAYEPELLRLQKRPKTQHFFTPGEEYEAKKALLRAMKLATSSLGVVDEYLDETLFDYLDAIDPVVELRLITGQQKSIFRTLFLPFATKRGKTEARYCSDSHDRFLVLDDAKAVHLGCSINGIGKKAFMLNDVTEPAELARLLTAFQDWWAKGQPVV